MLKKLLPVAAALCLFALMLGTAQAHEHRTVHEYMFVVGFIQEPAFEGLLNAVSVRITKMEDDGHGGHSHGEAQESETKKESGEMPMSMAAHDHGGMPVEGLEATLLVEVTHVPSGTSRNMTLQPVKETAGHYTAYFIPTATGQYMFRFTGSIEGMRIDETFESGPGRFADIEPATPIQFPEVAASGRELESAVRGALEAAQQAQNTALAVEAAADNVQGAAANATTLAIAGIVVGAIGIVIGGIGITVALRRRN